MKNITLLTLCAALLMAGGCKKNDTQNNNTTEAQVLTDFANVLANPNYQDLQAKANTLNLAVQTLNTNPTDDNLAAARTAWRNTRTAWEQTEGYLFGPIEDYNYDPTMDTWPVNKTDLDAVLASTNPLEVSDVDVLDYSLKGFHAIEYVLFGPGSSRTAAQITPRQMKYVTSLSQSLYNTTKALAESWSPDHSNYTAQVVNAGNGSSQFATRKAVFTAIVSGMSDICNEVANEKMETPLAAQDSTLSESGFSNNSTTDFKNNMTSVLNAYMCTYTSTGHSLSELVAAKNISLDNIIRTQINAAINSFTTLTVPYEKAIYSQQTQVHNIQAAINTLKNTLDGDLKDFVNTNIKD